MTEAESVQVATAPKRPLFVPAGFTLLLAGARSLPYRDAKGLAAPANWPVLFAARPRG